MCITIHGNFGSPLVTHLSEEFAVCSLSGVVKPCVDKTLSRARDPRANGAWLNKLTE